MAAEKKKSNKTFIVIIVLAVILALVSIIIAVASYSNNKDIIQPEDAVSTVLEDAGAESLDERDCTITTEKDGGTVYYVISFEYEGTEYVYKVDSSTGEIASRS
ncbi:MAG: hypothetical protein ACOX6J_03595 [Oscillospiraceae bacterium]|jgi:uncharacterized membrane protein YkoI